ncbi:uncharacterized protein RSE6_03822 [Rhynchosporium secalis]|uniref:GST N-terminal domain-containing protein n=1 Tax=Rhynchosporium secalis TaxID=38038 RepID=A0A1E1M3Q9_RHYSE|nr:uncharacterized protein RSE6_03822 [Rhynchosporium secalis]
METTNPVKFSTEGVARIQLLGTFTRLNYQSCDSSRYFTTAERVLTARKVKKHSSNGLVPIITPISASPSLEINDSLSICAYLAQSYPEFNLWPRDQHLRVLARSATSGMQSGYSEIRNRYNTNFVASYNGIVPATFQSKNEIDRLLAVWNQSRIVTMERSKVLGEKDEGFLFGEFGIACAFFWHILWRFRKYGLQLDAASSEVLA